MTLLPMAHPESAPRAVDVLRWPFVGAALRWRHLRTALQALSLLAAILLVLHGLFGPDVAPRNLATVVTWVHYRGLLVLALLAAGNVFCTACPFVLVRDAGRRLRAPVRRWPRQLRRKWMGVGLLAAVLFAYELFDLWALPAGTAWLVLAYFAAALAIDLTFAGGTFCKYLCPIGQFNFAASTLSPLEVTTRDRDVCRRCRTADCISGRRSRGPGSPIERRGCELNLFLPQKVGNLDCTFCLDCLQACPHDNVALAVRAPAAELVDTRRRSGIGRLAARRDIAALAIVFAFGALLNAFAMTAPVYALESRIAGVLGTTSEALVLAMVLILFLAVIPAVVLGAAGAVSGWSAGRPLRVAGEVGRFAVALIPIGFAVWIAHYAFHFLTGALTIVPVSQSAAADLFGWPLLGVPLWQWTGFRPGAVFPIQIGFVLLGTIGSLAVAGGLADLDDRHRRAHAALPWAVVIVAFAVAALWVLAQPMDMRGVEMPG